MALLSSTRARAPIGHLGSIVTIDYVRHQVADVP
jgi:hypothetical protein